MSATALPQVRFSGKNYVLPRIGQEGIPLLSINASKINVAINRIGDRNLLPTLRSEDFLNQITAYRAGQISDQDGVKVWSGSIDAKPVAQRRSDDRLPGARGRGQARSRRLCHDRLAGRRRRRR